MQGRADSETRHPAASQQVSAAAHQGPTAPISRLLIWLSLWMPPTPPACASPSMSQKQKAAYYVSHTQKQKLGVHLLPAVMAAHAVLPLLWATGEGDMFYDHHNMWIKRSAAPFRRRLRNTATRWGGGQTERALAG